MSHSWYIDITLPTNCSQNGTLNFCAFDAVNERDITVFKHSCECKGKDINGYPWNYSDGDTPTGCAHGNTIAPGDTVHYGPNRRINLISPMSGNLGLAYTTYGRTGLQIHDGRDQSSLWNTQGCIRVFDRDIKTITNYIDQNCTGTGSIRGSARKPGKVYVKTVITKSIFYQNILT
ncbi:hypothetical protein [Clostridium tagluense]|uniref:hypothetical protein n=1 Tax=Clostridium tagluense TaxID=360422 RepID=UPI001C6EA96C|nr:hypothetical protein [Clostridium tagluense]MBW9159450.1 hypothetical protein [Clostridium tagluense]WLC68457.1 hypothetical protein KTC93_26000 [Clostridium tagluense]